MLLLVRTVVAGADARAGRSADDARRLRRRGRAAGRVRGDRAARRRSRSCGSASCARRTLVRANLGAAAVFGAYVGFQFVGTLYLQTMLGWSALRDGAGVPARRPARRLRRAAHRPAGRPLRHPAADRRRRSPRSSPATRCSCGVDADAVPASRVLPTMLLIGIGFALCFPSLNMQATTGVADHEQGLASGLVNTSFQVGGALALAIVSAVVGAGDIVDVYRTGDRGRRRRRRARPGRRAARRLLPPARPRPTRRPSAS